MQNMRVSPVPRLARWLSSSARNPTGIVLLNMGGPADLGEVGPFLQRLFSDREIIQLPAFQNILGPWIAKRRTPKIQEQYREIGGGSPIRKWTEIQGELMCKQLDEIRPESAPHKPYIAFRYANPLTEECLLQMKKDGVKRAIAFSQYPHFSCTTAGSSLNHLWRESKRLGVEEEFQWSVIDRWPLNPHYIDAVVDCVKQGLQRFDENVRSNVPIVFSSHSLPLRVVERGDQYPQEMAATVSMVMSKLGYSNPYIHAWQSKVGPLPWITPSTEKVLEGLGKQGQKHVLVMPLGFTSDHVETLYELDLEYGEAATKSGIEQYERGPALNDHPKFIDALADLVKQHLDQEQLCSTQYRFNCPHCVNPMCRSILNPIKPHSTFRRNIPQ